MTMQSPPFSYFDRIKKNILNSFMPITIVKETATTALVDGHLGLGLYVGPFCMKLAIEKAKQYGVGFVVAQNSTHYGIAGYYSTMATDANCIGLTGTNARPSIAPTFGVQPCLGTNPLTFGIPTDEGDKLLLYRVYLSVFIFAFLDFPFVIDAATSINQRGKIEKYERLGLDTPRGMVIDNQGNERTDTSGVAHLYYFLFAAQYFNIMVEFIDFERHGEGAVRPVPSWRGG